MDLIIKPTKACNFACTFCSSNKISKALTLDLEKVFPILLENDVQTIIVNGGDPLMVPPAYYERLINFLDEHDMKTTISFTSNLWDFFLHPDKWEKLFKDERMGVCTSFQYGGERRIADGQEFTEELFRKVFSLFEDRIGYKLSFISVITRNNEERVLDTVRLAKELGTECKINPAFKSGRSEEFYPLYKAYGRYLDIIKAGLAEYEFNSKNLKQLFGSSNVCCPYNRNCYKTIRCISPDGLIHSCGAFNDDHYMNAAQGKKTYCLGQYDEKELARDFKMLKPACLSCDMFRFCNSCYKQIADITSSGTTEEHCTGMKALEGRLKSI
jgi:MoaA/NifB/PqqE/SkfB family radical SAM enzyme